MFVCLCVNTQRFVVRDAWFHVFDCGDVTMLSSSSSLFNAGAQGEGVGGTRER